MEKDSVRVVIADDSDLIIRGIESLLLAHSRFSIAGTARHIRHLLDVAATVEADVIVMNEWFFNIDILTAIKQVREVTPETPLIIMGSLADGLLMRDLVVMGVKGYLYKADNLSDDLVPALNAVVQGEHYLSPTARAEYVVASEMWEAKKPPPLTDEMRLVLRLLTQGETVMRISQILDMKLKRVYRIRDRLRARFNAKSNEHLIHRAMAEGFIYFQDG